MKILVKKTFRYMEDARTLRVIEPGVHDLIDTLAMKVLRLGKAERVVSPTVKKVAPENKVVEAPKNKTKVVRKTGNRRSTRSKSDE